jgi:UDP-3-O-[3-hydroxymyristoyl] glucosamine N-acyltransferase
LIGDPEIDITGIAPLDAAGPSHITFLSNPKLRAQAADTNAAALILSRQEHPQLARYLGARVLTDNPYAYFARAAQHFAALASVAPVAGIHPNAWVDPEATVAATASIGPGVTIEAGAQIGEHCVIGAGSHIGRNSVIGAHTLLHPRVSFLAACRMGERGIIQSGAVIGGDGFGFANEGGHWIKIPQMGGVQIGNDVEIGANTTIDRARFSQTFIGRGTKIDNLVQIAHNVRIGQQCLITAQVGIAGSTTLGDFCVLGGQSGVAGHLSLGHRVQLGAQTGVFVDIPEGGFYNGTPAIPIGLERRLVVLSRKLPDLFKKVDSLVASLDSGGRSNP